MTGRPDEAGNPHPRAPREGTADGGRGGVAGRSLSAHSAGLGRAVARGLSTMSGDAVVIMMADESDDCRDVVRYWHKLNEGYDCVFGSRFMKGGGVIRNDFK